MPNAGSRQGLKVVSRPGREQLYVRGTIRGRRVYESTGTVLAELAEEYRAAREAELYRAAVHKTPARKSFAGAVASYLTTEPRSEATRKRVERLVRFMGAKVLCDDIDQARVDRIAAALLRPGFLPATRQREITAPIGAVLRHAATRGWCSPPVFEGAGRGGARIDWLSPNQAEALVAAAAEHLRPLIVFLLCTGARMSEAVELEWRDVDLRHARIMLRDTKARRRGGYGRDRPVDLSSRLVATLAGLGHRTGAVFRTDDGKPYANHRREFGGHAKRAWATACREAGLPGAWKEWRSAAGVARKAWISEITPHHARHTYASWHYAVHRDLLLLKHAGGWSSVQLVERYAHLVPTGLAPAIQAFWGELGTPALVAAAG